MKVKLKKGFAPFHVKMFGKRWKIPKDEIPREVFNGIKTKVTDLNARKKKKKVNHESKT